MDIKIIPMLLKKLTYSHANAPTISNMQNHFRDLKISGKGILTTNKINITLKKNLVGGWKENIKLKDGSEYKFFIDEITPYSNTENMVLFIYANGNKGDCISLIVNTKESGKSQAILGGISNDKNCVKCKDKDKKYKVGDILMQITIKYLKTSKEYSHIKTIILHDTSIIKCYDIGIQLRYLKMITDGETYYSKYGFKPKKTKYDNKKYNKQTNYKKFKDNVKLFNTNRELTGKKIMKTIEKSEISEYEDEEKYYIKNIKPFLNLNKKEMIDTSKFTKKILNLVFEKQKDEMKISDKKRKIICNFINLIYEKLYIKIGYKEYKNDTWILKL